jgi:hypothetical protein
MSQHVRRHESCEHGSIGRRQRIMSQHEDAVNLVDRAV